MDPHKLTFLNPNLAPKARRLLCVYHSNPLASADKVPLSIARTAYELFVAAQQGFPPKVYQTKEASVPREDGSLIKLRIYHPSPEKRPVMLFFHGGGWCLGNISTHDTLCRHLANGIMHTIVSVDYKRAPEGTLGDILLDSIAAYTWCQENPSLLNAKEDAHDGVNAIAVAGDSAGAQIAAALSTWCVENRKHPPQYQLLLYPTLDLTLSHSSMESMGAGHFLTKKEMSYYVRNALGHKVSLEERSHFLASPLFYPRPEKLPPTIILTAQCDPLRDDGQAYARLLETAGGLVRYRETQGMIHGFMQMSVTFPREIGEALQWIAASVQAITSA